MFEKLVIVALLVLFSMQNAFRMTGMVHRVIGNKMIQQSKTESQSEMVSNFKLRMSSVSPHAYRLFDKLRMSEDGEEEESVDDESEEGDGEEEEETSSIGSVPLVSEDAAMSMIKEGIKFPTNLNGSDVRIGIIMARWNADVISGLYKGVNESLTACGVKPSNVFTTYVPGAYELPLTAKFLAASKRVDAIICLGCLIKGETMHFEYISQSTATGIMQVGLDSMVPVVFGVLTVLNKEQAVHRSSGTSNEGLSWGRTAVEMGLARQSALGMDRKQKADPTTPFVTFHPSASSSNNKTSDAAPSKPSRKIGF